MYFDSYLEMEDAAFRAHVLCLPVWLRLMMMAPKKNRRLLLSLFDYLPSVLGN